MADRATRILLVGIFVLLAAIAARLYIEHPLLSPLSDSERSIVEIFERVSPSVVRVSTITGANDIGIGSGFIWDASGNIVTNEHVVQGAATIAIWYASSEPLEAEVVGVAPNYDLAVIRLKQARALPPPVPVGTSKDLKVGQFAYAIGSPFGLDQSLTTGVVSALKRQLPLNENQEINNVIQTDAAIYPGNSGGPLLDSAGRLIGVNTIAYFEESQAALGFAIPVDLVKRIVPMLISNGRIPTAGIGIVLDKESAARGRQLKGVLVGRTKPGSPAERAGLQGSDASNGGLGDIITRANGQPIRSVFDLTGQFEKLGIGRQIELAVIRDGKSIRIEVEIIDIDRLP
jgi:2-alkenal reductase